ncbi:response regulator [Paenibacillus sp. TRM 82003]|nr:response regulator [Paenibacillus sp. TRM 82003]
MIKAVLVDDEPLVLDLLKKVIRETSDIQILGAFTDPEQALMEIPKLRPDVLFLDVDMPEMNGMELATKLVEANENAGMSIVFVTAYEQYAIRAFELNAMHYILKPADAPSVDEVMKRIYQKNGMEGKKNPAGGEIYFFGNMHLRVDGNQINFLSPKIEELLALLILHRDKGINKWRLIDVLWEEASMEKSQQNLYTMIFRLKQTLRNAGIQLGIKSKGGIYTVDLGDVYCDLAAFGRLMENLVTVERETIDAYEQAISIYQGDLLEGKDYMWSIPHRERYYRQFAHVIVLLAAYYSENQHTDKLKQLKQAVKPLVPEEDYAQLIR